MAGGVWTRPSAATMCPGMCGLCAAWSNASKTKIGENMAGRVGDVMSVTGGFGFALHGVNTPCVTLAYATPRGPTRQTWLVIRSARLPGRGPEADPRAASGRPEAPRREDFGTKMKGR